MTAVKKELRSVNDKKLAKDLTTYIDENIVTFAVRWDNTAERASLLELFDEFFSVLKEEKAIETYKIVCDRRNNTPGDEKNGIYHLDFFFRQAQCVNTTQFRYTINTNPNNSKFGMLNADYYI